MKIFTDLKNVTLLKYLFLILVAIPTLYFILSRYIIKLIYNNKFLSFFNNIIVGQSEHPLDYYYTYFDKIIFSNLILLFLIIPFIYLVFKPKYLTRSKIIKNWVENHTTYIDSIPVKELGVWIALAAGLGLFLELSLIRIHSSYFQLFAYFKNISLLSCFLGLGIGYTRGTKNPLITPIVLPLVSIQLILLSELRNPLYSIVRNPINEQLGFGIAQSETIYGSLFNFLFISLVFSYNALCFIPLGQLVSRLMAKENKLVAYGWNLLGSLAGISIFTIVSFLWLPPISWFIIFSIGILAFLINDKKSLNVSIFSLIVILVFSSIPRSVNELVIYSPYQKLTLQTLNTGIPNIRTADRYYQNIHNLDKETSSAFSTSRPDTLKYINHIGQSYALPYYFKKQPEKVLILASGAGNDIAAALANEAKDIDAVEIDPVIHKMGSAVHPQAPYSSDKVKVFIDDARAFLKKAEKKYDLIVFGLLDSHTLLSGKSGGIRLDSYVYTVEAFKETRKLLNDDGLICLSFWAMHPDLAKKLYLMLEEAFDGEAPVVYRTHHYGTAFLIGNKNIKPLQAQYKTYPEITSNIIKNKSKVDIATDNWPFFYMPKKVYPLSYIIMILLILIISTFYVKNLSGISFRNFSFPCFFLGAGFMLIETKGITELSLYFGSTWIVISIVISAILIMAYSANLIILKMNTPSNNLIYFCLFISLLFGLIFTYIRNYLSIPFYFDQIFGTLFLTIPLFFSGFAFSYELKMARSVMVALSSNIIGAMVGGCLEYNAMYFGFRSLYILAIFMYLFSFITSKNMNGIFIKKAG